MTVRGNTPAHKGEPMIAGETGSNNTCRLDEMNKAVPENNLKEHIDWIKKGGPSKHPEFTYSNELVDM